MTLIPKHSTRPYPPGNGYSYREPKTGRFFDGMLGNVTATAQKVIAFKLANPHVFPEGGGDLDSTIQLIYAQKFGTMPWLFLGQPDQGQPATPLPEMKTTSTQAQVVAPTLPKVCIACGSTEWDEILCKTCGGRKVTGYTCKKCGKKR